MSRRYTFTSLLLAKTAEAWKNFTEAIHQSRFREYLPAPFEPTPVPGVRTPPLRTGSMPILTNTLHPAPSISSIKSAVEALKVKDPNAIDVDFPTSE